MIPSLDYFFHLMVIYLQDAIKLICLTMMAVLPPIFYQRVTNFKSKKARYPS